MTKKDYVLIAKSVKYTLECGGDKDTLMCMVKDIVRQLQWDNPRFDRAKFLKACGMEK